jgi:hypothetical protein
MKTSCAPYNYCAPNNGLLSSKKSSNNVSYVFIIELFATDKNGYAKRRVPEPTKFSTELLLNLILSWRNIRELYNFNLSKILRTMRKNRTNIT